MQDYMQDYRQGYRQIKCVIISATFENKHVTTSRTYSIQSYPYGFKICCATVCIYFFKKMTKIDILDT